MNKCKFCDSQLQEDFNFCPSCGEPLNEMANEIYKKKEKQAQLKLVLKLVDSAKDVKTLEMLKSLAQKLQ